MTKNWITTTCGVLTIVGTLCTAGLAYFHGQGINTTVIVAGLSAGAGLIGAKDASNHSTIQQVEAATKAEAKSAAPVLGQAH